MPRLSTLLRTLWYLRPEQWKGQLKRRLRGPAKPLRSDGPTPRLRFAATPTPVLGAPGHVHCDGLASLEMLNHAQDFSAGIDWETTAGGPLWRYQLHYFDWARSVRLSPADRERAVLDWIERHPAGTGWDSGPISLRLIAWLKLLLTEGALPAGPEFRERMLASIADQVVTLRENLETHLLGNHYLWNLLALCFAGVCLEGGPADDAFDHRDALLAELDEQFGADGAHFERSPMYHALLLEHVLDLLNALAAAGERGAVLVEPLRERAARMLGALEVFTLPDGDIALFGDSAHGVAARPSQLHAYAEALGVAPERPREAGVLRQAGFARLEAGPFVAILSAGMPSPTYQPGHAHCDALALELAVGGERVVTDTGVFEYVPGARRDHARSTAAHATVVVDGQEQAELWAAHRVGGRPDVALTHVTPQRSAEGVCAGFATPEVLHKRTVRVAADVVRVDDAFDRPAGAAELWLPLAPGLEVELAGTVARVALRGGRLEIGLPPAVRWRVASADCYPEFGKVCERPVLVGSAEDLVSASFEFRFRPRQA